ncbi:dTDP-4-dehydrorhamnose reductase [Maricaulaceae bacterium EIL42A08]|nr:dTDP-4-dehydrorhamnose reductase [Maricaulaceae bacterium EIL42A08]
MTRLLILGEHGQLARALAHEAPHTFDQVECAGRSKADLATPGSVSHLIDQIRPTCVINAAAYTQVDVAETYAAAAHQINAQGAGEAADATRKIGARFVHVSTDYVFGAGEGGPYGEDASPAPINIYGQSKLAGEVAVLAAYPEAAVVRTAAVFSGRGSDFPSAMWTRAHGGQALRVVADQLTCPTFAGDLAKRLLKLSQISDARGIFHCTGQPGISWYDFAREAVAMMHTAVEITPVTSDEFDRPAPRPTDSRLSSTRLERFLDVPSVDWRSGLKSAYQVWKAAHL